MFTFRDISVLSVMQLLSIWLQSVDASTVMLSYFSSITCLSAYFDLPFNTDWLCDHLLLLLGCIIGSQITLVEMVDDIVAPGEASHLLFVICWVGGEDGDSGILNWEFFFP